VKVFASWSGGKESALATYKAILQGYQVSYLLNFISEDGERSRSHGILAKILDLQAKAIGIPMVHTFVFDGPIFKTPLEVIPGKKEKRDNVWFLEISVR